MAREEEEAGRVRKVVTVVFSDLAGSTGLGERLDPESLTVVMGLYFERTRAVLERHGGTVQKFIGDAVMAVFGIPVVREDDALRAVRAAAELRTALAELNAELVRDHGVSLELRTGVNTGEVLAGDPAATHALALGDTVNVAARLEQVASSGEVLLGHATWALVRDAVEVTALDPLTLKGKSAPVGAWRLERVNRSRPGEPGTRRRLGVVHQLKSVPGTMGPGHRVGLAIVSYPTKRANGARGQDANTPACAGGRRPDGNPPRRGRAPGERVSVVSHHQGVLGPGPGRAGAAALVPGGLPGVPDRPRPNDRRAGRGSGWWKWAGSCSGRCSATGRRPGCGTGPSRGWPTRG